MAAASSLGGLQRGQMAHSGKHDEFCSANARGELPSQERLGLDFVGIPTITVVGTLIFPTMSLISSAMPACVHAVLAAGDPLSVSSITCCSSSGESCLDVRIERANSTPAGL